MTVNDDRPTEAPQPSLTDVDAMRALAELGRIDLAATDLTGVLGRIAALARVGVPGAAAVSVTLVAAGVAGTAAQTSDVALTLDERQYDAGYGPCLDAAVALTVNVISEMDTEQRWPAFVQEARERGVRSSLSVGIPVRDTVTGGLNLYAHEPQAFDDEGIAAAKTFAGYAAVALANAHLHAETSALAGQLSDAMASRAVIEQAKGIVMAQRRVSAEEAFGILSRASQTANRKLRDIAQSIVDAAHG